MRQLSSMFYCNDIFKAVRHTSLIKRIAVLVFLGAQSAIHADDAPYQRIVSINLDADELLLQLADPGHILALSQLASDPELSRLAHRANEFTSTSGATEEILLLEPDIVFAGEYTNPATIELLIRSGIEVVLLPVSRNLDDCRRLVRKVAGKLGLEELGESLIADMDERISRLESETERRGTRPTALIYGEGGYTLGDGTLAHHILEAAGLENHAASFNIQGEAGLPLEKLLLSPPDFLVILSYYDDHPTLGSMELRHRALRRLSGRMHIVDIPLGWTLTGNNLTARTAEHLWNKTDEILSEPREKKP